MFVNNPCIIEEEANVDIAYRLNPWVDCTTMGRIHDRGFNLLITFELSPKGKTSRIHPTILYHDHT